MRPVRSINGLPNNLVQMFFSTLAYSHGGYMADHLGEAAMRTKVYETRIDILRQRIEPPVCASDGLGSYLPRLRAHIASELERNELPFDHVSEATMEFSVHRSHPATPWITGKCTVITKHGRLIKGKTYTKRIYPLNASGIRPDFNTP